MIYITAITAISGGTSSKRKGDQFPPNVFAGYARKVMLLIHVPNNENPTTQAESDLPASIKRCALPPRIAK